MMPSANNVARIVLSAKDETKAAFTALNKSLADSKDRIGGVLSAAGGLATVLGAPLAFAAFDKLLKQVGDLQDMADSIGENAEAWASLQLAAGTTGTELERVAGFSVKLTKALTGVDDESKAAGAAIKALGLEIEDFKKLQPADQVEALAKALEGFNDGPAKTAVMEALAKGASNLIPFLKELSQEGSRQNLLTKEQISLADEYGDKQAKLRTQINLHAQIIATQMLPVYNAFTGAVADTIEEIAGLDKVTKELKNSDALVEFAKTSVTAIAFVVDAFDSLYRLVKVVGKAYGASFAIAASVLQGDLQGARTITRELQSDVDNILGRELFGEKLRRRLAGLGARSPADADADRETARFLRQGGTGRKELSFDGATKSDKGNKSADQERKAQLASDLDAIKREQDQLLGVLTRSEKVMEAMRSAGLLSDSEYYDARRRYIQEDSDVREAALQREISRYQQEKAVGKDKIEQDRKIAAAEAAIAEQRAKTQTELEVLAIQQAAAVRKLAAANEEARLSEQALFDAQDLQYQRELEAFGRGDRERTRLSGRNAVDDKYLAKRDELEMQRSLLQFEGKWTDESEKQHAARLAILQTFHAKAIARWDQHYADMLLKSDSWQAGASRALENYIDSVKDASTQTANLLTNAFQSAEDALVDFVRTGKLDFRSLVDSVLADLTRMAVRQGITAPLAQWLLPQVPGYSGGGVPPNPYAQGEDLLSGIGKWIAGLVSYDVGTSYVPEDMVAKLHQGEMVIPRAQADRMRAGGGGQTVIINYQPPLGQSRTTTLQHGAALRRMLDQSGRNL